MEKDINLMAGFSTQEPTSKNNRVGIDYISDLHLDFWIKEKNNGLSLKNRLSLFAKSIGLMGSTSKILILAGDLGHYFVQDSTFLLLMKEEYDEVLLVCGNHDLYLVSKQMKLKYVNNSNNRLTEMYSFCKNNGIHYLNGNSINLLGVRFSGLGMTWDKSFVENLERKVWNDEDVMTLFNKTMNDSIMICGDQFKPANYLKREIEKLDTIDHCDVMITHYAPKIAPDAPLKYAIDKISTFYYFDGETHIQRISPKFWVHGHTHTETNFKIGNTRILCNPLGYPRENENVAVKTFFVDINNDRNRNY